ncbi:protein kinase domain-containing protein [Tabrizicola sp.]|uniref:serine/threonine protein kinase n=1 Tax=Tabrizicola sp. TaxID=2005166 RepID=UPI003F40EBF3
MLPIALKSDKNGDGIDGDELKPGTSLLQGQYTIEEFLNSGGFGITYLARDSLNRRVVIKECFHGSFCRRSKTSVGARSRSHQGEFRSLVGLFVREAFSLSKLKHPNIVGVHQVFEDNNTAYMALDYIEGGDLFEMLEDGAEKLSADQIMGMLKKLLGALSYLHSQGVLHRDISPDNILLNKATGEPVLIDFGAAKEEVATAGRALSALRVVKDGYSPQEFYINGSEQSPSSDLFSLGATFYHLISGETAPNAQARLSAVAMREPDPYVPLDGRIEGYPPVFLRAIDQAMSMFPKDRIPSAQAWLEMLDPPAAPRPASRPLGQTATPRTKTLTETQTPAVKPRGSQTVLVAAFAVVVMIAVGTLWTGGQSIVRDDAVPEVPETVTASAGSAPSIPKTTVASGEAVSEVAETATAIVASDPSVPKTPAISGDAAEETEVASVTPDAAPVEPVVAAEPVEEPVAETGVVEPTPNPAADASPSATADADPSATADAGPSATADAGPTATADPGPAATADADPTATADAGPVAPADTGVVETAASTTAEPAVEPVPAPVAESTASLESADEPAEAPAPSPASEVTAVVEEAPEVGTDPISPEAAAGLSIAPAVRVPFLADGENAALVGTVLPGAPSWMQPGQRIVEVNGAPVRGDSDMGALIADGKDLSATTEVQAIFGVEAFPGADIIRKTEMLPVVERVALKNGMTFDIVPSAAGPVVSVAEIPEAIETDLQVGDVLVAYATTQERLDAEKTLASILTRELGNGVRTFSFAVDRNGSLFVAFFTLTEGQ